MENWAKKFQKYRPKTCAKHIWTILVSILGIFVNLRIFRLFSKFRSLEPPWNTGQKFLLEKFAAKHARSKHIWIRLEMILAIFGILKIFWFLWNFSKSRACMEHWAKNFLKSLPRNMFKTRLDTFGNDFRLFGTLKIFGFFRKFSNTRPSMGNWAKFFRKIYPKIRPKHVWILLVTIFGFFWNFENFCFFLKVFEDSTFHGKLGNNFSKKLSQIMFTTSLDTFGNDFGHFWSFENF